MASRIFTAWIFYTVASLRWVKQNGLCADLHVDTWYVQDNILITRDGNACLADFGITYRFTYDGPCMFKLRTARYMAPEQFYRTTFETNGINPASKESDVYSLAMTSFTVCSSSR